ncbi:TetR/AcrR family transcriptional regulator [Nocardia uniformis]|uniref:TetR/AcrR family transcriptional regulator n=1 Tax=Nocardia uniformis TaxID=53432 RepID=A0A849CET8_9NOCA|nr:TetR/AcrR family transcriptional regulator [Nocardia uniformis]NNH75220.1 TetR/AcrR family transcriptional regulator [Nocardia uniformis]
MVSAPNQPVVIGPARGTRPANRRQLIVAAAADLFYRKGYTTVGMGEVADAVAIGPSALYRHFRGKQDLLVTVVGDALHTIDSALAAATADSIGASVAAAALEHRAVGVLWRRESRHLSAGNLFALREVTHRVVDRVTELVRVRRPELGATEADLLARCVLAIGDSVSFHSQSLPEPEFRTLLGELIDATIDAPVSLPDNLSADTAKSGIATTGSRREKILTEATKLFAHKGFAGVSMDDIGAEVGISGPSVYNHFPTKADILIAAVYRGDEWLRMDMTRAFAQATDARDGLDRLLRSYSAFVFENPHLVQILLSEAVHLPETERHRARASQRAYIGEWVNLARQVHPAWGPVGTRIRVQAAQTVLNEIALAARLRTRAGVPDAVRVIGTHLLAISEA